MIHDDFIYNRYAFTPLLDAAEEEEEDEEAPANDAFGEKKLYINLICI